MAPLGRIGGKVGGGVGWNWAAVDESVITVARNKRDTHNGSMFPGPAQLPVTCSTGNETTLAWRIPFLFHNNYVTKLLWGSLVPRPYFSPPPEK